MSKPTGNGKGAVFKVPNQIATFVALYNFDIDSASLKGEHKSEWLDKEVVPLLKASPKTTVKLRGTASRSGDQVYNREVISKARADEVSKYLVSKGVAPTQIRSDSVGADLSTSPLKEYENDRAVLIFVQVPLTIERVSLWTDGWTKELEWDDIIGLDTAPPGSNSRGVPIDNVNVQVEASGVPRSLMPDQLAVQVTSRAANRQSIGGSTTIPNPITWTVRRSTKGQPGDISRTWYRHSVPADGAGKFFAVTARSIPEVAYVVREGGTSDRYFRQSLDGGSKFAPISSFRGLGVQTEYPNGGSELDESPDAKRLLMAGGVEVFEARVPDRLGWQMKSRSVARLIRNPADVFYYSGHGLSKEGCLAIDVGHQTTSSISGYKCWAMPEEILQYWNWKKPFDLEVLILSSCSVLRIDYVGPLATGGPGLRWSKLLKSKGGPLDVLLAYSDGALSDENGANDIAKKMGERIKAGLTRDQWVRAWLEINANNRPQSRPAVGMDGRGYWKLDFSTWDTWRKKAVRGWDIVGPFPIPG